MRQVGQNASRIAGVVREVIVLCRGRCLRRTRLHCAGMTHSAKFASLVRLAAWTSTTFLSHSGANERIRYSYGFRKDHTETIAEAEKVRAKPRILVDTCNPDITVAALRDVLAGAPELFDRGVPVKPHSIRFREAWLRSRSRHLAWF